MEITKLTDAFAVTQNEDKNITFINASDDEQVLTFAQLYSRALGLLKVFQDHGMGQGDELIININNNQFFLEAFWACLFGGIVPVPVAVGISDEHRAKLVRIFSALTRPHLYTEQSQFQRIKDFVLSSDNAGLVETLQNKTVLVDQIDDISSPGKRANINLDDTAFIQFSSGSTNEPKGVVLTHRNVMTTIHAIIDRDKVSPQDVAMSWMPLTHDMGLIGFHLVFIVTQASQCIMPADLFSRRPLLWLLKTAEHRATILNSPNFGYKHFLKVYKPEKFQDVDLSSIRLLYNGAEPISVDLYQKFLHIMEAHGLNANVMHTVYGLAEASLAVTMPHPGECNHVSLDRHKIKIGDKVVFLAEQERGALKFAMEGPPVQDCLLRIVDEKHSLLDDETVGEILIKGNNVTAGYYLDDDTNRRLISAEGWLNTGDVGFMVHGELVVTGRSKDIIFVNGQNYYPHDIETLLTQHGSFELGKVVAAGINQDVADDNELLIFILHRGSVEDFIPIAKEVARSVNEYMGLQVAHVIPVKRIPKTTSGKIQRHKLIEMMISGEFREQLNQIERNNAAHDPSMPEGLSDTERQLLLLCRDTMESVEVGVNDNLFEIGISSLILSELHQQIEDLYPDKVDIVDIFDHQTLAELAKYIDSK